VDESAGLAADADTVGATGASNMDRKVELAAIAGVDGLLSGKAGWRDTSARGVFGQGQTPYAHGCAG
jgi:hypothetical protein